MSRPKWMPALFLALATLLSGCKVIALSVVGVATVVGFAGYAVYKTGEVAVVGVGKAAKAAGEAVASGSKSVATVIYADGEFKTEYACDIKTLWIASDKACRKANFIHVSGTFDALSGLLTARTQSNNTDIVLKMKSIGPQASEMAIRVGLKGDLKTAELVHGLILNELPPAPASKKEVKE